MPSFVIDTVTLLQLIHDGFDASKEKDDEIYRTAQSLLSVLTYHLRHPLATVGEQHGESIRYLEAEVAKARAAGTLNSREGTAG